MHDNKDFIPNTPPAHQHVTRRPRRAAVHSDRGTPSAPKPIDQDSRNNRLAALLPPSSTSSHGSHRPIRCAAMSNHNDNTAPSMPTLTATTPTLPVLSTEGRHQRKPKALNGGHGRQFVPPQYASQVNNDNDARPITIPSAPQRNKAFQTSYGKAHPVVSKSMSPQRAAPDYEGNEGTKLRAEAFELEDKHKSLQSMSKGFLKSGNHVAGRKLLEQANATRAQSQARHQEASRSISAHNNKGKGLTFLDLHGLFVPEATSKVNERFDLLESMNGVSSRLILVTGAGKHSRSGQSVLKPACIEVINQRGYRFEEANEGCLHVLIPGKRVGADVLNLRNIAKQTVQNGGEVAAAPLSLIICRSLWSAINSIVSWSFGWLFGSQPAPKKPKTIAFV